MESGISRPQLLLRRSANESYYGHSAGVEFLRSGSNSRGSDHQPAFSAKNAALCPATESRAIVFLRFAAARQRSADIQLSAKLFITVSSCFVDADFKRTNAAHTSGRGATSHQEQPTHQRGKAPRVSAASGLTRIQIRAAA